MVDTQLHKLLSRWDSIPVIGDAENLPQSLDGVGVSGMDLVNIRFDMWLSGWKK